MQISKLSNDFYIGPQPTEPDLAHMKAEGVRTVFDFRHPSETRVPNGPAVTRQGLDYVNIPIRLQALSDDEVDQFRREAEVRPGPFLLHCGVGTRAAAMYLMKMAADQGWDAPRTLEEGRRIGINLDGSPPLKFFVASYVTRHAVKGPDPEADRDRCQGTH
jgi:uncharacterized protein (TIGR01244 family)